MKSVSRRRRVALVIGSAAIAIGGLVPAATATPAVAAGTPVTAATTLAAPAAPTVLPAAKSSRRPSRVAKPRRVAGGSRHDNVRISWKWVSGASRYVVQAAPKKSFAKKGRVTAKRSSTRSRPSGGRLELTVPGLKNATTYFVRVRAIAPSGAKGRWSKPRKVWTKVHIPERITTFSATPGPNQGEVTFRWKNNTRYTSYFMLDLASTTFHPQGKGLPKTGRNHVRIKIPGNKKKFVLSAAQAARAGAPVGSGNHLYYRFSAVNKGKAGKLTRLLPNLHGVQPAGPSVASASSSTEVRFATFNVASQQAGARSWTSRAPQVAREIIDARPGIVGLQELSPGPSDDRYTDRLEAELGNYSYRLVRKSPYTKPGYSGVAGNQGARILYDARKFELLSTCDDNRLKNHSIDCTIEMARSSNEDIGRRAAFAKFEEEATGARFWFVSVHLTPDGTEDRGELRERQITGVVDQIERMNTENLPIVVTGDLNSWQNRLAGNAPHDFLVGRGFVDAFSAAHKVNPQYSTYNKWDTTVKKYGQGFGVRLDYVLVKGGVGVLSSENVMKPVDSSRASDHNLVLGDVRLPVPS